MEKILLALDARKLSTNTIDFACYISRLTRSKLTGVFLENLIYEDGPVIQSMHGAPHFDSMITDDSPENFKKEGLIEDSIRFFKDACCSREVSTLIHRSCGVPVSETLAESRFADLVIIDPETSFTKSNEAPPGKFVKDVLLESECPVIISPYSFDSLDEIIFTYNGTKSSVFAIKQFGYLFPELRHKKVTVLSIRSDGESAIEEQFKMKELLKSHYNEVEYVILKGEPSDQLFGYLIEKKNCIVVMGAYGRGMLSRFLKPSRARLIVKAINLPIFVAHV
jgi:hypothetical protein